MILVDRLAVDGMTKGTVNKRDDDGSMERYMIILSFLFPATKV